MQFQDNIILFLFSVSLAGFMQHLYLTHKLQCVLAEKKQGFSSVFYVVLPLFQENRDKKEFCTPTSLLHNVFMIYVPSLWGGRL